MGWEAQTKLWSVTHSELQAQNETLEQTKRALTHEHQVKTEIHTATKAELEQKLAALMETLTTTQKRAAEDIKVLEEKKAKLESEFIAMQRGGRVAGCCHKHKERWRGSRTNSVCNNFWSGEEYRRTHPKDMRSEKRADASHGRCKQIEEGVGR